ncbi:MAG: hypothetical protein ACYSSO_06195 [Planctomycetota bacterium]|jgi:hypothetical protein
MRKGKVSLGIIVTFFVGVFVGFGLAVLTGAIIHHTEPDTLIPERPKRFGDIEIRALDYENDEEDEGPDRTLMIKRNEIPFFYAAQDKDGKVKEAAVVGENESIRLKMKAVGEAGEWRGASYGCVTGDYIKGEWYFDINFDGQFDEKFLFDDDGELISKYIYVYLDKEWRKAERLEKGKAITGDEKTYIFSDDTGWVINK